jgi:hypothetical protein
MVGALQKNFVPRLLTVATLALKTARFEWVQKFCKSGGHIVLLRELARQTQCHQYFDSNFPYPTETRDQIIAVLMNLVDCKIGSRHVLDFSPSLEILVGSIDWRIPQEFASVLSILSAYLFRQDGPERIYQALARFGAVSGHTSGFHIFQFVLTQTLTVTPHEQFFTFLNGLYSSLSGNPSLQQKLALELIECGVDVAFENVLQEGAKSFAEPLTAFVTAIRADRQDIMDLFGAPIPCGTAEEICAELKHTPAFGALVSSLLSIRRNQPELEIAILGFLTSFVLRYRHGILSGTQDRATVLREAFDYASNPDVSKGEIVLPDNSLVLTNYVYAHLSQTYGFIADEDLRQIEFPAPKSELQDRIEELLAENAHLRHRLMHRKKLSKKKKAESEGNIENLRSTLEARALAAETELHTALTDLAATRAQLTEIQTIRQELAAASSERGELESLVASQAGEIEQLRLEIARLRTENEEIPSLHQAIAAANAEKEALAVEQHSRQEQIEEELAAAEARIEELQSEAEQIQAKNQELIALARAIPTDATRLLLTSVNQILPARLVGFSQISGLVEQIATKVQAGVSDNDPEVQDLITRLVEMLNAARQERETIVANVESFVKTSREGEAAAASEAGHLREVAGRIISSLTGEGSSGQLGPRAGSGWQPESREDGVIDDVSPLEGPVRRFNWTKVPDSLEWSHIRKEDVHVDTAELFRLLGTGNIPDGKLLSPRTERQFQLALKKIGRTPDEIVAAVRRRAFGLGEPAVLAILRLTTSLPELENLLNFNGDAAGLSDPERFAVLLHRIPDFREEARTMIDLHRFDLAITITLQGVMKLTDGLKKLETQSPNLQRAVAVVLRIGNQLNAGTDLGGAAGFVLNDVLELRFTKTNEKGLRLLHVVVGMLAANGIEIAKVKSEADALVPASRVSLEGILASLKLAEVQLAHRPRTPFVLSSSVRVREAIAKVQQTQLAMDRLTHAFGIREELLKGSGLFLLLIAFASELSRAAKENAARHVKIAPIPVATPVTADSTEEESADDGKAKGLMVTMSNTLKSSIQRGSFRLAEGESFTDESAFKKAVSNLWKSVT